MTEERIVFYIDGFNLYFGLKEKGWRKYYWLNLQEMSCRLIRPNQKLIKVRYFTALINQSDEQKRKRQLTYLEALKTLPLVDIHYGTYLSVSQKCFKCGNIFTKHNEKKSDVNIAVTMITDALEDIYDAAVLISGDSDLTPVIETIKNHFPSKRILLFFPPKRFSTLLKSTCHAYCGTLNKTTISKSQFPETVLSNTGFHLKRPSHWT